MRNSPSPPHVSRTASPLPSPDVLLKDLGALRGDIATQLDGAPWHAWPQLSPEALQAGDDLLQSIRYSLTQGLDKNGDKHTGPSAQTDHADPPNSEKTLDYRVFSASLELQKFCQQELSSLQYIHQGIHIAAQWIEHQWHGPLTLDTAPVAARIDTLILQLDALGGFLPTARPLLGPINGQKPSALAIDVSLSMLEDLQVYIKSIHQKSQKLLSAGEISAPQQKYFAKSCQHALHALETERYWLTQQSNYTADFFAGSLPPPSSATKSPQPLGIAAYNAILHRRALAMDAAEIAELAQSTWSDMCLEEMRLAKHSFHTQNPTEALLLMREQSPISFTEALAWLRDLLQSSGQFAGQIGIPIPQNLLSASTKNPPQGAGLSLSVSPAPLAASMPTIWHIWGHHHLCMPPPARLKTEGGYRVFVRKPLKKQELANLCLAELEAIAVHDGVPGVALAHAWRDAGCHWTRSGSPSGFIRSPALAWGMDMLQGWGHFVEELMQEAGFRDSPASRLCLVRRAKTQALLARCDIALHTGTLSAGKAVQLLQKHALYSETQAQEAIRFLLMTPTAGVSALVGKHLLWNLRKSARTAWKTLAADDRFYRLILRAGPMPVAYHFEMFR